MGWGPGNVGKHVRGRVPGNVGKHVRGRVHRGHRGVSSSAGGLVNRGLVNCLGTVCDSCDGRRFGIWEEVRDGPVVWDTTDHERRGLWGDPLRSWSAGSVGRSDPFVVCGVCGAIRSWSAV